jgi:hypothetical protein
MIGCFSVLTNADQGVTEAEENKCLNRAIYSEDNSRSLFKISFLGISNMK